MSGQAAELAAQRARPDGQIPLFEQVTSDWTTLREPREVVSRTVICASCNARIGLGRSRQPSSLNCPGCGGEMHVNGHAVSVTTSLTPPARRPRLVVKDVPGEDMRPAPELAKCAGDLVTVLNDLREWAGELSYRAIAEESGQLVSYATVYRALTGTALPPLKAVLAVVIGCGGDQAYQQRFATAWRRIKTGRAPDAVPARAPLRALPAAKTG